MRTYYSDTRANGKPVEPGTICFVTDLEDGTHPVYTYGKTHEEIAEKLGMNALHTRQTLQRQTATPTASPSPEQAPQPRARLTGDEVMQATADLQNPAKAGEAMVKLVQDTTGIDLKQMAMHNFGVMAKEWEAETPDFYGHPGNIKLVVDQAKAWVGGDVSRITKALLTRAYQTLRQSGYIREEPAGQQHEEAEPTNLTTFPGESPVQRTTERPRGARFATGSRSTNFRAPQTVPTKTLKYTKGQIDSMPLPKARSLLEARDRDYAEACEYFYPSQTATA